METVYAAYLREIDEKIVSRFKQKVREKRGNKQGVLKLAILEALEMWVKAN